MIARKSNDEGYALLETFEVDGSAVTDEPVYAAIEALAARVDADAFMVLGDVDGERLERIAEWVRIVVHLV